MRMSMPTGLPGANPLRLEYPQSLAVYDDYAAAQKTVDFLSDNKFPVEHLMIAANEAVAGFLEDRKLPALYRVH